jgi:hypothetical protein
MRRRGLALLFFLLAAAPLVAFPDPTAEELKENARKLQQWRKHPDQYERLRRDAQIFLALPPERREQILALDQELHEEPSPTQARLTNVLERYAEWLEKLSDKERDRIRGAANKQERLKVIHELREQEWLRHQPDAVRKKIQPLPAGTKKTEMIQKLRQEERQRRLEWHIAARFWDELTRKSTLPTRLSDFAEINRLVPSFVEEYLYPFLTKEEKKRLDQAEGHWPRYPQTLVELADKHPIALKGDIGPTRISELPAVVQKSVKGKTGFLTRVKAAEGKWPEFAIVVTEVVAKKGRIWPYELWPTGFKDLSPQMREFVEKKLPAVLNETEMHLLVLAEKKSKWPEYPHTIQDLARKHGLEVPWQTLPGPREMWDKYRFLKTGAAELFRDVPRRKLRDFALFELDPKERAALKLSPDDPASWRRLMEAYFHKRPEELRKLRQADQGRPARKKDGPFINAPAPKKDKPKF